MLVVKISKCQALKTEKAYLNGCLNKHGFVHKLPSLLEISLKTQPNFPKQKTIYLLKYNIDIVFTSGTAIVFKLREQGTLISDTREKNRVVG